MQQLRHVRLSYVGLAFGLVGYFIALSPSLMPRPALFMGVVAGLGFALCYGAGVVVSRVLRSWRRISEPSASVKRYSWLALAIFTPIFIIATGLLARYWQNDQRALLDLPALPNIGMLTIVSVAVTVFAVCILIVYGLRWIHGYVRKWVGKLTFLSPCVGAIIALVVATGIVIGTLTGVLQRTVLASIDSAYSASNNRIDPTLVRPQSKLRSGSAMSDVSWQGLGREGRRFVASGPSASDIAKFSGTTTKEPIRVYAGLNNASGRQAQVDLAIKELDRTGAFERKMLIVAIPTGSGWIESESVEALEYMHGGDTAIVSAQYSYLPSGFAFVLNQGEATAMAKELFHAVEARVRAMPEETRPKLVAYGLSLGSYGGQADFTGESDFASRLDAGVFVGTPGFSEPWRTLTHERDRGTPQVDPVYHDAKVIRFASSSSEVINEINPRYKIVYFQYATDPFVWFDAPLLYAKPDWMREAPGRGVSSHLRWFPVITFTQVAIDQIYSLTIAGNNGHDYSHDTVAVLAAATKPQGWSADKSRALQALIAPPEVHKAK